MDNFSYLVYDSGIGGLNLLAKLAKYNPNKFFYYLSDSDNCPYGGYTKNQLLQIARNKLQSVGASNYCGVVLACNTLSSVVGKQLANDFSNVEFYGVLPNVAVAKKYRSVLLATPSTCSSTYIMKAKRRYPNLIVLPKSRLAFDVEKHIFNLDDLCFEEHGLYGLGSFQKVLLGCTHYCFLKSWLKSFYPNLQFLDGDLVRFGKVLGNLTTFGASLGNLTTYNNVDFIGADKKRNFEIFKRFFTA